MRRATSLDIIRGGCIGGMSRALADEEFERLTDRERRVLRLLGSGHSVKSAAAVEGVSDNAANELLRSARRKLGIGSSREAARLLAEYEGGPQKIRDENSVISQPPFKGTSPVRISKGAIAMSLTALAASTVFILTTQDRSTGEMPEAVPPLAARAAPDAPSDRASASEGAPRVVGTVPAQGAVIAPGPLTLSVTFDRPMLPEHVSFVRSDEGAFPDCSVSEPPPLSADGRTFSLDCVARAPGKYVIYFNRPPYMAFRDAQTHVPAQPARLEFTVRGESAGPAIVTPRVVLTSPAEGAVIEPGPFEVAVTFNRPMAPNSYAFSRSDEGAHPECTGQPQLSADGRTYAFQCLASAGARYVIHLNRPPHIGFVDAETRTPASEARLEFKVRED